MQRRLHGGGDRLMLAGPRDTVKIARKLRKRMSIPEVILWQRLRRRPGGFKFRRQHPAGPYVLDFFCSEAKLAIEVDGFSHYAGDRPWVDAKRERWLRDRGMEMLRISAADVGRSADEVVEWVVAACEERTHPLHQPPHEASAGPPPLAGEDA